MGTIQKFGHRKLKLLEQITPAEQELIDALKENGWSDVDESGNAITAREYSNQKPDFDYRKVGVVIFRKPRAAANTGSGTISRDFDCIKNVKKVFNIGLYKSRVTPTESIYELLTDIIDGESTQINYYKDGRIELMKRNSMEVVYKGTWQCMGNEGFKICWDGKCSPVYIGVESGVNVMANDQSCCTGTSGSSGSAGTSGSSGTSGGGSAPFSCPSGYVTTSLSADVVADCDNKKSFKPCMKGRIIKELQEIPALAFYIESIQKRDNKSVKLDEYYGPIMKEAVEMLQSEPSRSLTTDGIIGCTTLNSLLDNPDAPDTSDVDDNSNIQDNLDNSNTDIKKDEDNKTDVKKIKPSFQVDRSFFNPNDEW